MTPERLRELMAEGEALDVEFTRGRSGARENSPETHACVH